MTQEEKQLLIKDLCARLSYRLKGRDCFGKTRQMVVIYDTGTILAHEIHGESCCACGFVPYLRPLSTMTKKEKVEYCDLQDKFLLSSLYPVTDGYVLFDWLNEHHFDYRDLIGKGLALEAPEGMYNI